jgi:hypothetical protein
MTDPKPTAQVDTAERLRLLAAPSRDSDWVRVQARDLRSAADELDQASVNDERSQPMTDRDAPEQGELCKDCNGPLAREQERLTGYHNKAEVCVMRLHEQLAAAQSALAEAERERDDYHRKVGLLMQPAPGEALEGGVWKMMQLWIANRDEEKRVARVELQAAEQKLAAAQSALAEAERGCRNAVKAANRDAETYSLVLRRAEAAEQKLAEAHLLLKRIRIASDNGLPGEVALILAEAIPSAPQAAQCSHVYIDGERCPHPEPCFVTGHPASLRPPPQAEPTATEVTRTCASCGATWTEDTVWCPRCRRNKQQPGPDSTEATAERWFSGTPHEHPKAARTDGAGTAGGAACDECTPDILCLRHTRQCESRSPVTGKRCDYGARHRIDHHGSYPEQWPGQGTGRAEDGGEAE